ncbi:MAG: S41 family peptidase [Chitinivibrionales bacterium]|nr:S41 family peptidase [Chitinivibrionales bacterium]
MNFKRHIPVWGIVIFLGVTGGLVADVSQGSNDNFYSDVIRLDNVVTKIHENYVEEVNSNNLVDKAVDGMLSILDPHTTYFQEKQYNELLIHTEGKFGGLGIQISVRDKILTVMTPIAGTPATRAGIQSGDQIIKINNKSTKGISVDDAVNKLRGEPGSEVTITIRRKGEKDADYTITREIIHIKSVPYYGVLDKNIGYIRLNTFAQESGEEVEKAIKELLKKNIKGLVFDLRTNPGGLLPQAIEVSSKFLPKKSLVVSTRGRVHDQNKEFFVNGAPELPSDIPMTVLVNSASASASEIVAGAIQDWDRGVIVGDTTFGKGSVQSILPLDKTHHLKLTTAFYYTPSGRCINKPENGIRGKNAKVPAAEEDEEGDGEAVTDSAAHADSLKKLAADTVTFKTNDGRIVHGGGGIVPDKIVKTEYFEPVVAALFQKSAFFKFANFEYPRLKAKKVIISDKFEISAPVLKDFNEFLDSIKFEFQSFSKLQFDEFKRRAGLMRDTTADSSSVLSKLKKPAWNAEEQKTLQGISLQIDKLIQSESKREFSANEKEIKRLIKEALLVREFGQDHEIVYRFTLGEDTQLKAAMELLTDKIRYDGFLKSPQKPAQTK